jgi:hypothetical protein
MKNFVLKTEKTRDTLPFANAQKNLVRRQSKIRWTELKRLDPEGYRRKLLKRDYEKKEYLRKRRIFKWTLKVCKILANEIKERHLHLSRVHYADRREH